MFGEWTTPTEQYVAETRRYAAEVGLMERCAPRDWMCEPIILQKTGKSVGQHQGLTVADYCDLLDKAPELPWVPVIQGWELDDYLRCVEMYHRAGVDLFGTPPKDGEEDTRPLVGVGTICRRQGTTGAAEILRRLASEGLRLHAFGLKGAGIPNVAPFLASSDSLAWSYAARRAAPLPECIADFLRNGKGHKNCANCMRYALRWLAKIERQIAAHADRPYQLAMAL